jgi:hypothetical protein
VANTDNAADVSEQDDIPSQLDASRAIFFTGTTDRRDNLCLHQNTVRMSSKLDTTIVNIYFQIIIVCSAAAITDNGADVSEQDDIMGPRRGEWWVKYIFISN